MDRESVAETPVKRRKTENGYVPSQSQEGSFHTQDTILPDREDANGLGHSYDTVPTLPVKFDGPRTPPPVLLDEDEEFATIPFSVKETPIVRQQSPLQSSYITQPTQPIHQNNAPRSSSPVGCSEPMELDVPKEPEVQVVASSPAPAAPRRSGGMLANSMAPAGTAFRPPIYTRPSVLTPQKMAQKPKTIIDISSDDEVRFAGGSSGDEKYSRDLKPTLVKSGSVGSSGMKSTQSSFGPGLDRFRHNAESMNGNNPYSKESIMSRSSDPMANAYGNSSRPNRPPPTLKKQGGPAKALPVYEMALLDIKDYHLRSLVERVKQIVPTATVQQCYDAVRTKKGNFDDAVDFLFSEMSKPKKRQRESDDELASQQDEPRKQSTKLQIKDKKSILERQQERQAALAARKSSQVQIPRPNQPAVDLTQPGDETPAQPKPRRKLVRRADRVAVPSVPSSPVAAPPPKVIARSATPISLNSDPEMEDEPGTDPQVQGSLLKYFNECTVDDLVDMASTKNADAELVLSKRPFQTLEQVRQVVREGTLKPNAKRKSKDQPVGDKIVDTCEQMWTGYDAVDQLVQQCEDIGKPLVEEMKKWGVDVFGSANDGELEIVNLDNRDSEAPAKDSGIGTPSSMSVSDEEGGVKGIAKRKNRGQFFEQPVTLAEGVVLKDYQVVGINWLAMLFRQGKSCILADDMGLGKTCQVISFIAHLRETGIPGPHVIVVPSSVLENWLREFETFCPDIQVVAYHGSKNVERPLLREQILEEKPDVIVTTYTIAKATDDRKFFSKHVKPTCCIYDEGHMLKNPQSQQYRELMKIGAKFRLLLTGTPLQNNLSELIALLGFMMPDLFRDHQGALQAIFKQKATMADTKHQALLSAQRIARAKSMMTPFILRRKKHQVLKDIPAKHSRVDLIELLESQSSHYDDILRAGRSIIERRKAGEKLEKDETTGNVLLKLRKVTISSLLLRRIYTDDLTRKISKACVSIPEYVHSDPDIIFEDFMPYSDFEMHQFVSKYPTLRRKYALKNNEWMDSCKIQALVALLKTYRANGDRVLIFSQFKLVLDILEEVLETENTKFARLDGNTDINQRQELIDTFYKDESITVFMLSTKAGGAGINLACANKVIIFDGSFNPQDDVQAENRAHRVGQTREVEVVRLITKGTVEENIHSLSLTKLALDEMVAGDDDGGKKAEASGEKRVQMMLEEALERMGEKERS